MREFFRLFLQKKWDKDYAYTSIWFADTYKFSQHVCRHHLNNLVYTGKLICLKVNARNYYMLPDNAQRFEQYLNLKGVRIVKGVNVRNVDE